MRKIPAFYFDADALKRRAPALKKKFVSGDPFEHVIIDRFVSDDILQILIREFPKSTDSAWRAHGAGRTFSAEDSKSTKLAITNEMLFPAFTRHFMQQLNSQTFLRHVEDITGIRGLIPDPSFSGGGLHSTGRGGRLLIHTDANRHPQHGTAVQQILNGILYLNEDWPRSYRGQLELWSESRERRASIAPLANRFVLFKTDTRSFHGHPEPLACPPNRRRNSLAVYYYVVDSEGSEKYDGRQRSPNWVPSHPQDHNYAKSMNDFFAQWIERFHGQRVQAPELATVLHTRPGLSAKNALIFKFAQLKSSTKARKALSVVKGPQGEQLTPFAALGAANEQALDNFNGPLLFVDHEGRVFLRETPSHKPTFVMFAELIMPRATTLLR